MENDSLIIPEIQNLRGTETTFSAPEEVGKASIRRFAVAIGDDNPLYLDEEYAKKSKYGGIIAPPTFVCETGQFYSDELLEDGMSQDMQDLAPSIKAMAIRGGNEYEFFHPLRPEDVITARSKIIDIYEKTAKTGRLLFIIRQWTYANHKNKVIATNKETMIYRFR
jgi:acyl dehydratase